MRASWVLVAVAVVGCKKQESAPPGPSAGDADALWDLAPDETQVGWVATPRAIQLAERGVAAVRRLAGDPDLAALRPQIDAAFTEWFGGASSLAELGIDHDKGFAMFGSTSGALLVIPVGDRDKLVAAFHGARGETDTIRGLTCKPVKAVYACATTPALLSRLGKNSLRGKAAAAGGRGDVEVYAVGVPLGKARADIALAFELEPGQVAVRGAITGITTKSLDLFLAGATKPSADPERSSGFAVVSLGALPRGSDTPVTPLVTIESLMKSIKGPLTASVPAGAIDLQVHLPLTDPAPFASVLEQCPSVSTLAAHRTADACRFTMPSSGMELDAWVDGKELRLGAHKGAPTEGNKVPMTAWAKDIAGSAWTVAMWGRGTLIAPSEHSMLPAGGVPEEGKALLHAMMLLDEAGFAFKLDDDAVRFRAIVRTAWANPDDVVAKLVAISGDDLVRGKASETASAIAAAAPDSPFAADLAAGQGGMVIPVATIGTLAAIAIPAFTEYMKRAKKSGAAPTTSE